MRAHSTTTKSDSRRSESSEVERAARAQGVVGLDVGVADQDAHVERPDQRRELVSDVPEADQTDRALVQPDAQVPPSVGPSPLAREALAVQEMQAEGEHQRHGRRRHGPANAVGCDRDHHAAVGAGGHVDIVVADAVARHDAEPVRTLERRAR